MTDLLDKVIETAKKLRKAAKKIDDQDVRDLICDLNMGLADLKMQTVELREEGLRLSHELHEVHDAKPGCEPAKGEPSRHALAPVSTPSSTPWAGLS